MTTAAPNAFHRLQAQQQDLVGERLPERMSRLRWDKARLADHQRSRLRWLLEYAMERSPFYARRLAGVDPGRFELFDIGALPVLTKAEMMEHFDELVTDPLLSRSQAEAAIARTGAEPEPILDKYIALATGGASGRRGVFVSDVEAGFDAQVSVLRGLLSAAPAAAVKPGALTLAMVAAPSPVHATGLAVAMSAASGPVRFAPIPATLPFASIVEKLAALEPDGIVGYPSLLARLARERAMGRLHIRPRLVVSTSEKLTAEFRQTIRGGFDAPIIDVLGTTEGLFGITRPDDSVFAMNSDVCIVELVDEANQPVPAGTPSARVLITNLSNRVQPLIRYEVDDRLSRQPDAETDGHLRVTIDGRADEVIVFGDTEIHPVVLHGVLLRDAEVVDFQARQTPSGLDVAVQLSAPLDIEALGRALESALRSAGVPTPAVNVRVIDAFERHGQSGKLRRFIPLG